MKTRLYLDTRKGGEPFPLSLVISRKGQSAYINLGVSLTLEQWNAETRTVADLPPKRWPQRDMVRNVIDRKRTAIETALMSLEVDGRLHGLTALQVRDAVLHELGGDSSAPVLFLDYFADVAGRYTGRTRELYEATLTKVRNTIPDRKSVV